MDKGGARDQPQLAITCNGWGLHNYAITPAAARVTRKSYSEVHLFSIGCAEAVIQRIKVVLRLPSHPLGGEHQGEARHTAVTLHQP